MKKSHQIIMAGIAAMGFAVSAQAQVQEAVVDTSTGVLPYVVDGRGVLARSAFGLCYRTGFWTLDLAKAVKTKDGKSVGAICEPDLIKDEAAPAAAAPAAAAPAAAAAAAPAVAPAAQKVSIPSDALFAYDKAEISDLGKSNLTDFANNAKKLKQLEVVIAVGHADRIGSDKYNQKLSEKRADRCEGLLGCSRHPGKQGLHRRQGRSAAGYRRRLQEAGCRLP